jgi:hypothetical protein
MTPDTDGSYRKHLVKTRQASQTSYDSAVLMLSGGGLGVSIAFIKDIVGGANHAQWMPLAVFAWFFWGISCASVLYSHFSSVVAHDEWIDALDNNREPDIASDKLTRCFNVASGVLFLLGAFFFCLFTYINIASK